MTIRADIARAKRRLVAKARRKGIWENFGQREVRELRDKYFDSYMGGDYANVKALDAFDNWCMNYTGEV